MSMASYTADDWVTTAQAAAILGVRPGVITHLVKKRKVTTRRILGSHPELLRSEVEEVGRSMVRPARPPAPAPSPPKSKARPRAKATS
jgi:hypothetical protein